MCSRRRPSPSTSPARPFFSPSPSGRYLAVVRVDGDKKDEPCIEIWDSFRLVHNISCKGKGHGSIYSDEWFGSLEWSPDEKYLAYIAEPVVNGFSFWDKDCKEPSKQGHKFDFREDWGEMFIGLSSPTIFLLDIEKGDIISVKLEANKLAVGQVIWSPDGTDLVFTGWPISHRRLGLKFCYNRESGIYRVTVADVLKPQQTETKVEDKTKAVNATLVSHPPESRTARFPRFSPDGSTLIYLATEGMLTHGGDANLLKVNWKTKEITKILGIVGRPENDESFPGLFLHSFPRRPFLDNSHILLHSEWRSPLVPIVININTGKVQKLAIPGQFFSAVVADVIGTSFLLICSSPVVPTTLVHGRFETDVETGVVAYSTVHESVHTDLLRNIEFSYKSVQPTAQPLDLTFDIIFVHPKPSHPGEKFPLLLYPHGGPHSSFTGEYSTLIAFLTLLGYSVLLVNYRGSLGFGNEYINSLPGRCGELDVSDCVDAAHHVLDLGLVDPQRIGVIGGSHGGFLAAHLIGRTFDKLNFKACVMRNPVVNIAGMVCVTDIPDWCLVETGEKKLTSMAPNLAQLGKMYEASPMAHIDKIKTPTLFLLGELDKRVPPSQGISMHYALLERNITSRVIFYPKNGHGLLGPDADPDQSVNTALFLHEYLK